MDSEVSLKRERFATNIRTQQRQRKRREIREKFNEHVLNDPLNVQFDNKQFAQLRKDCVSSGFTDAACQKALDYLCGNGLSGFKNEMNLKFLAEFTKKCYQSQLMSDFEDKSLIRIKSRLEQCIKYEVSHSPRDQSGSLVLTNQLDELLLLKYFFASLFELLECYPCYQSLWHSVSHIRNKELKLQGFHSFKKYLNSVIEDLSSEQFQIIVATLDNYAEDLPELYHEFICLINILFEHYYVGPVDAVKLVDILIQIVSEPFLEQKIELVCESTTLYQNITGYLDKTKNSKFTSFELTTSIATLVSNIFSSKDDNTCNKVYMKNVMILQMLRSWLPIAPNVSVAQLEHLDSATPLHTAHKCTHRIIACLCNIMASGHGYLEVAICRSDLYRAIVMLYSHMPSPCKEQISYLLYVCVSLCENGVLRIMLESKLPEIIAEMLKEVNREITRNSLNIVKTISESLDVDIGARQNQAWLYSTGRFKQVLDSLGAITSIESLVNSPDDKTAWLVEKCLNLLL